MLNRVIIMGRLGRDPDLRYTQAGKPVASFSLAVDRDFKDKTTGEKSTDFIDIVAWRQTAEFVSRFFTKGRMAVVEGRLQLRDWTDRDAALQILQERGVAEAMLYERRPVTPPALEKALGKGPFAEIAGDLVTKKPGKPALAPESDRRPPYNAAQLAFGGVGNG